MPRIDLRRRSQPQVGDLRDLVWVCTTVERPDDDVSTIKERPGVFECHARIRNMRPDQIMDYQAVFGSAEPPPTVAITIRYPLDVKVDLNHWVYRETGDATIWYKVRAVEDMGNAQRFLVLSCNIDVVNDRRNDPATQEPPPVWEAPGQVPEDAPIRPPAPIVIMPGQGSDARLQARIASLERRLGEIDQALERIAAGEF